MTTLSQQQETETVVLAADKTEYLACYIAAGEKAGTLKHCINGLLQKGVDWRDLVAWPKEHGCDNPYARKILSQTLTQAGIRRRKPGAGRETPQSALALLAYAIEKYNHDALPLLLAAYRAGRARNVAGATAATSTTVAA